MPITPGFFSSMPLVRRTALTGALAAFAFGSAACGGDDAAGTAVVGGADPGSEVGGEGGARPMATDGEGGAGGEGDGTPTDSVERGRGSFSFKSTDGSEPANTAEATAELSYAYYGFYRLVRVTLESDRGDVTLSVFDESELFETLEPGSYPIARSSLTFSGNLGDHGDGMVEARFGDTEFFTVDTEAAAGTLVVESVTADRIVGRVEANMRHQQDGSRTFTLSARFDAPREMPEVSASLPEGRGTATYSSTYDEPPTMIAGVATIQWQSGGVWHIYVRDDSSSAEVGLRIEDPEAMGGVPRLGLYPFNEYGGGTARSGNAVYIDSSGTSQKQAYVDILEVTEDTVSGTLYMAGRALSGGRYRTGLVTSEFRASVLPAD
ncbi:MAG: hypothetical protein AAGA56_04735 [Myxococcota bacterium]